jgi:uncharacterized protein
MGPANEASTRERLSLVEEPTRSGQTTPIAVTVRVYAELNGFIAPERRHADVRLTLRERDSGKDVIESIGVPHTEVELVLVNGTSVGFAYRVQDGDRIAVYPSLKSTELDSIEGAVPLRPPLEGAPRFVLDMHLGRLATHLRLLGFDTLYWTEAHDPFLAKVSEEEARILLTRDRGLLKRGNVTYGCHVWETNPEKQVVEVLRRFDLFSVVAPFTRCTLCNGMVDPVSKEEVLDQLEPKTRLYFHEFRRCRECGRVYWKGSHYQRILQLIERFTHPAPPSPVGSESQPPASQAPVVEEGEADRRHA